MALRENVGKGKADLGVGGCGVWSPSWWLVALQVGGVLSRSLDRLARALCLTRAEIYLTNLLVLGAVDVT